jgi:hypothetical protein
VAHPQVAVFARLADGGAQRVRAIEGQKTMLGRTMHAIAYDPIHDEIVVPHHFAQGLLTFAGDATGETPPKRVLIGPKTLLIAHDRLGIDPANNEIYVPEGDKVLVFPREANGDVAPVRILSGPDTRIGDANSLGVDPTRNLLVVTSTPPRTEGRRGGNEINIYPRTANGNMKPLRTITGVPGHRLTVYPERGLIFLIGDAYQGGTPYVAVYGIDDSGKVSPRYTIGGPNGILRQPRGVAIDAKNKAVIVSDKDLNAVMTFSVPEIFDGARGTKN